MTSHLATLETAISKLIVQEKNQKNLREGWQPTPLYVRGQEPMLILGSLSNNDGGGDGNENGEKAIGSDWQNNNFGRAWRFIVHFFAVTARLRRKIF